MKLSAKQKLFYGVGAFGYGAVNQTFGNFLMFFGTCFLGLSGTAMGVVIGISTVWDAITDPIVGSLSDNYKGKFLDKRRSFMFVGCMAIAIINVFIWSIDPDWSGSVKFVVMLFALLLVETFNTIYATPYGALGIDIAKDYNDRTSVQNYKITFQFLALIVPSILMAVCLTPKEYVTINTSTRGYIIISAITSVLCLITGFMTIFNTKEKKNFEKYYGNTGQIRSYGLVKILRQRDQLSNPSPLRRVNIKKMLKDFFEVLRNKNVLSLILGYVFSLSAGAVIASFGMYVFTYTFHFSNFQIPIIMSSLIVGIIAGQPLWYKISCHFNKKKTILIAIITVLVGILLFSLLLISKNYFGKYTLVFFVSVIIVIISCGIGCLHSLPISMFADEVANTENVAISMGFLTFSSKISNAVITFLIGVAIDVSNYNGDIMGIFMVLGVTSFALLALKFYKKYKENVFN
ncbi:MAG: MFS transporter [Christensenellaceae bacterium]|jgi:Na+/melibiose symporter-like transporter|nr:MFS transporter [Christensenellaceae bacterium]